MVRSAVPDMRPDPPPAPLRCRDRRLVKDPDPSGCAGSASGGRGCGRAGGADRPSRRLCRRRPLHAALARVLHAPEPVRGGDGREHLVYELVLSNDSAFPPGPVTVRKVLAEAGGKTMETLAGEKLRGMMEPFGVVNERTPLTTIQPGGTAKVLMDVSLPGRQRAAGAARTRARSSPPAAARLGRTRPLPDGHDPGPRPPGADHRSRRCAARAGSRQRLLRRVQRSHRSSRAPGQRRPPRGRALRDRLRADRRRPAESSKARTRSLGNYPFFGDEVLSATAGTVVGVVDGLPDGPIDWRAAAAGSPRRSGRQPRRRRDRRRPLCPLRAPAAGQRPGRGRAAGPGRQTPRPARQLRQLQRAAPPLPR